MKKTYDIFGEIVYSNEVTFKNLDKKVTRVVELLSLSNKLVATAESCTGGLLSELITSVSGSSKIFELGVCTYSNEMKQKFLNVPYEELKTYGAVSKQVASSMVRGLKKISGANICVSVTGIAGPTGGTNEKSVGTVYIGFIFEDVHFVRLLNLCEVSKSRLEVRKCTAWYVFDILEQILMEDLENE